MSATTARMPQAAPTEADAPLAVEATDVTLAYHHRPALWDVDLEVPQGVLMAIVGPNGAGKTTLLRTILGLLRPAAGRVRILGRPYRMQRHLVAYVPQRSSVDWDFPTTVRDVVAMGTYGHLGWIRRPGANERRRSLAALRQVGMEAYADRQISQLSGGQQQRVFLARALVQDAEVYLMDEPFQGVDATTERAIVSLLANPARRGKDRGRGAPRPANGGGVLRLGDAAQRAPHRSGSRCGRVHRGQPAGDLRRARLGHRRRTRQRDEPEVDSVNASSRRN